MANLVDRQVETHKMPQVGDKGLERWGSKAFIYIEAALDPAISRMARMQLSQAARRAITWKALFTPATRRRP